MKRNLIKVLSVLILSLGFNSTMNAADAVVTYVSGKVEVNRNNAWVGLNVGDIVYESETISTGFQSEAKIKYNGSLLSLSALTRVTLEELSSSKSGDAVNVYLNTGAVRSKVTHTGNERVSYTVRSPVAVASVRGTDFVMMSNGRVQTFEGAVAVYPARFYVTKKTVSDDVVEEEAAETESIDVAQSESLAAEGMENAADTENAVKEEVVTGDRLADNTNSDIAQEGSSEYVPAVATTNASDISSNAPAGAVVVGKNQATEISTTGTFKAPSAVANSEIQKAKSTVTTAAEKEAVSSASSSAGEGQSVTVTAGSTAAVKKSGLVTVKVIIE